MTERKRVKIHIIGCSDSFLWYRDRVGHVFDVLDVNDREDPESEFCLVDDSCRAILAEDCGVINSPEEFAVKMSKIEAGNDYDPHDSHLDADCLMSETLRDLGYGEGIAIFENIRKWYS